MLKRHHKLILILSVVGVFVLLYLLYKRGRSMSSGTGAADYSSIPTIISTGGGGINFPMQQSSGVPQSYDATIPGYSGAQLGYNAPSLSPNDTMQVMPGTSGSGVPQHTAQAQEFSTAAPIPVPSAASAMPSFYATAQDLPYQQLNTTPGDTSQTLRGFLEQDLKQYEISAAMNIGNKLDYRSTTDIQATLTGEAGSYCSLHPDQCGGDRTSLIAELGNAYTDFIGQTQALPQYGTNVQTAPSYVNPSGIDPIGTPVQISPGVWKTPNQFTDADKTALAMNTINTIKTP